MANQDFILPGEYTCDCGLVLQTETWFNNASLGTVERLAVAGYRFSLLAESHETRYLLAGERVDPRPGGQVNCPKCDHIITLFGRS